MHPVPLPTVPAPSARTVPATMRLRNLWGRNWLDSSRIPLLIAVVVFAFAVQVWQGADWSPILFALFGPHRLAGVVTSVELNTRRPSDGRVWEVHFEYPASSGAVREAASWAPTSDSKRGIFWKPFPRPVVGARVEVEELPLLNVVRIQAMRTGWLSLDGALWLIVIESFLVGAIIAGGARAWRGNHLLESGTLGRATLEGVQVLRGRGRYFRMKFRLLDLDGVTFKLHTARREGFVDEGDWEWCLYEPDRPTKAVLLKELPALPTWARTVRDAPRG